MDLRDRFRALIGLRVGGSVGGKKVLRVARLPSRVFVDGSMALTGVAVDGLYGMARLTVHETELNLAPASDPAAGTADSVAHPYNARSKYYAVVSLGRQTFASRRVRQSLSTAAAAAAAPPAAKHAGSRIFSAGEVSRFRWNASAAVVLQRSGATVAQLAIYKAGRVDGALGDRLQCWCQVDLAGYFADVAKGEGEDAAAEAEAGGDGAPEGTTVAVIAGGEPAALPPALLRTTAPSISGESSGMLLSKGGCRCEAEEAAGPQPVSAGRPEDLSVSVSDPSVSVSSSSGEMILQDSWLALVDPGDPSLVRGRVRVSVRAAGPVGMEQQLWRRLLPLADLDGDGLLTAEEFAGLLEAMGTDLSPEEVAELFHQADRDGDGSVDADELAAALTACHQEGEFHRLMRRCPVDGAQLLPNDDLANIIYVTLALDEGTGESLKGGYTTPEQVSRSWLLSMTEWATQPLLGSTAALWRGNEYRAGGLRQGAAAAHILVFDRATKRVVEEAVSPGITMAMRALYQSSEGSLLLREGTLKKLKQMSDNYGARTDSPESAADILRFLQSFRGQINMKDYVESSPTAYPCFNQFFYRKVRPEARPIAAADDPSVIVSAADCRLMVFNSVGDATRCWIKGRKFSLAGMLGDMFGAASAAPSTANLGNNSDNADSAADGGSGKDGVAGGAAAAEGLPEGGSESDDEDTRQLRSMMGKLALSATDASTGSFKSASSGGCSAEGSGTGGLSAAQFEGGSMVICRLAPQDYHRFHVPVGGRVESITDMPGELMTVNPIAINSPFADVFTRNKRSVLALRAPGYGLVAYVAIGATVVGSIRWTVEVGQELKKGDEAGYFAFGGSTCVVLFPAGVTVWDADLVKNSLNSLETRVLMGERLGVRGGGEAP